MECKTISREEFDKIMGSSIHVIKCPKCGSGGGEIVVRAPWYGKVGASVRCNYCHYETKLHGTHAQIFDTNNRIGTPMTSESMMEGILKAVEEYNSGEGI